jgi:hypothetical protein
MDELLSTSLRRSFVRRRPGRVLVTRRPWQRSKGWSPEEIAAELQRRRAVLLVELRGKWAAQGVPVGAREEVVSDAMTAVVMDSRPILSEQHLLGAFWLAVDYRLRRRHQGRDWTRLGSRERIPLNAGVVEPLTATDGGLEQVELVDRIRRAADWFANLDERERQVMSVMASYDVGALPASRLMGLPHREVRAVSRSARAKLDRVAAISAAGRMCDYRYRAIAADVQGRASGHEARAAQAHLQACSSCRMVYRRLRREMGPDWQRRAAAALAPAPTVGVGHMGWLAKVSAWLSQRPSLPRGAGERTAEVAGGAGIVKVAAAGTAIVVAGGALTGHFVHAIEAGHAPAHHRGARVEHVAPASLPVASIASVEGGVSTAAVAPSRVASRSATPSRRRVAARRSAPPSRSLDYLAVGGAASSVSRGGSSEASARIASASEGGTPAGAPAAASSSTGSSHQSGGGTTLKYLGQ